MTRKVAEGTEPPKDGTSISGLPLPPLPPSKVDPRIITPRLRTGSAEEAADDYRRYTAREDPENPGYLTNGLAVLGPPKVPAWQQRRGGRVVRRKIRGRKGGELVYRIHDPESTTELRYDSEARCPNPERCVHPAHRHNLRNANPQPTQ